MGWTGTSLESAAWGALAGYATLWLLAFAYKKLRGVEGMGEGDFKLLAGLGALLGWQLLPSIVLLASGVGALVGIGLIVFGGHKREVPIPFGPYLVGGGIAAIFFGQVLAGLWFPLDVTADAHRADGRHRQRQEHRGGNAGGLRCRAGGHGRHRARTHRTGRRRPARHREGVRCRYRGRRRRHGPRTHAHAGLHRYVGAAQAGIDPAPDDRRRGAAPGQHRR